MSDSANKSVSASRRPVNGSPTSDELDLGRLLSILWHGKWWIAGCGVIGLLVALLYLVITPYSYTADALLKIEAGSNSPLSGLSGVEGGSLVGGFGFGEKDAAVGEIPIIKSRDVLGQTVRDMDLTSHLSLSGFHLLKNPLVDHKIEVDIKQFDVPAVYLGKAFSLYFPDATHFQLNSPDGKKLLDGVVGGGVLQHRTANVPIKLQIASSAGVAGRHFSLVKQPWLAAVDNLKASLDVNEVQPGSGILQISLSGPDKQHVTKLVNSVANNYVAENIEARSQDAEQSLKFLNSQLPELKKQVNQADARLAAYQKKHQPVDLSAAGQALLQRVSTIESSRSQLRLKIAQLSQQYTPQYPEVQAARKQLAQLNQERNQLEQQIDQLPSNQKAMLGLQRDVKVNTELYTSLLNKAQELRVVKAGTIGNVRIVDPAVIPIRPTSPHTKIVLIALTFLGLFVGIGIALLRAALRRGASDPTELEAHTGESVYAVIPYSDWLAKDAKRRATRQGARSSILARDHADDLVVEALRSLRTSLNFAQLESGSNVILITGPSPGVGKSFLSLNLGYLLADAEQRVAVVDADMRRGHLHDIFERRARGIGLSEILTGQATLSDAKRRIEGVPMDVITSGTIPPNPSELLMRQSLVELANELSNEYDMVILDAPPILAVTDAAIIAASIKNLTSLLVLHSGAHPMQEIDEAIARFTRQGGRLSGLVLNRYKAAESEAYYGYGHYQYAYASSSH